MNDQDLPEPVYLGEVQLIRLLPGDVGVLKCPQRLTAPQRRNLFEAWKQLFPDNRVIILEEGMDVGVISCEPPG